MKMKNKETKKLNNKILSFPLAESRGAASDKPQPQSLSGNLKSWIPAFAGMTCAGFLVFQFFSFSVAFAQDKITAVVNDEVITQKDVDDFSNFMRMQMSSQYTGVDLDDKIQSMEEGILDRLIEDRLILLEAKKNNIKVDSARIEAKVNDVRKRYKTESEFQQSLKSQGLTLADVEVKIKEQLLSYAIVDVKIRSKIVVNPSEVTAFYQDNIEEFKSPQMWEFESIAVDGEAKAREIFNKLRKPQADIESIAAEYSSSVNKMKMKQGQMKKDVEDIIFKLNPKDVSEPIKIESKYYIFRLSNIIPPDERSLAQAQGDVYTFLYNKKMQEEMARWLDELRKKAYIKIIE